MIALDASFVIDYLNGVEATRSFLEQRDELVYYVPTLALFEVAREAAWAESRSVADVLAGIDWTEPLAFDAGASREAVQIHAELLENGTPINAADVMIAGICRHHGASLVTRDGDFTDVSGLELVGY
ncbi:homolog to endonuclease VapC [Natrialba magadii ATCC 43099]|uniref:Ribonuclease VapC n=1 Tax=Natrialba magadii (strain ATCC 43099 / DSM 3394 / CCM 3739 / CIP 104546 / IAM 13178 / JCM 8861 / NBRC 102185 / NCIMB 2190 / MS3) TaxID=547559 RepID=D3SSK9_NATMM|nr:PIN domain-containing protein [Natrialba magadii]ADD06854.1 homolog to endonuclease VapC [Natrialba magadii ATCC 43099]ELY28218.1 PilT protein domain-containing protein [Natrialba magadii ATCC 43099]